MSYPINQPITYTAVASTVGMPSNTFAYSWAFDDSTTASTASTSKTWITAANHSATVTATDNTTGASATASKTIVTADWTTPTWVSTGLKIIPTASASITNMPIFYSARLLKSGNLLINAFDISNQSTIVVYDTQANTRSEYVNVTGTLGSILSAITLTLGPNAGSILLIGQGNGRYGFFNPATGTFTLSPTSMPASIFGNSLIRTPMTILGNGLILILGTSVNATLAYDQVNDAWATRSACPQVYLQDLFTLAGNRAIAVDDSSSSTYVYSYNNNQWVSGPSLPNTVPQDAYSISQFPDGRLCMVRSGATCPLSTWTDGDASFTSKASNYPFTTQDAAATSNNYQALISLDDGNLVNVGGTVGGGGNVDTKTIAYFAPNDAWITSAPLLTTGKAYRIAQLNGKLWRCGSTGVLEYMVWS